MFRYFCPPQLQAKLEDAKSDFPGSDISIRDAITLENLNDTLNQPLILGFMVSELESSYAASIRELSALLVDEDEEFNGVERVFPDGYVQIVEG